MENKLISIIVPVYCAENTLERCVNSILNQTYSNWELLLIDDGSPDSSSLLCDKWANADSRIRCYHKKNGGASSARNMGLDNIKGDFLTFLDSDDALVSDCLSRSIDIIEKNNLDALQFRLLKIWPDKTSPQTELSSSNVCNFESYIQSGRLSGCGGGNVFKTEDIIKYRIRFNEKLHYLEDAFFNLDVLSHCNRIMSLGDYFYLYYYNPDGSDKPKDWDYYLDSMEYGANYKKNKPECGVLIDGWCTMLAMRYITLADKHSYKRFSQVWNSLRISNDYLHNAGRKDVVFFEKMRSYLGTRIAFFLTKTISRVYYRIGFNK